MPANRAITYLIYFARRRVPKFKKLRGSLLASLPGHTDPLVALFAKTACLLERKPAAYLGRRAEPAFVIGATQIVPTSSQRYVDAHQQAKCY
jgi:hypothetical protein